MQPQVAAVVFPANRPGSSCGGGGGGNRLFYCPPAIDFVCIAMEGGPGIIERGP